MIIWFGTILVLCLHLEIDGLWVNTAKDILGHVTQPDGTLEVRAVLHLVGGSL